MTDFNPGAEGLTTEELTLVETRLTNETKSVPVAYVLRICLGGIGLHNSYIRRIMLVIFEIILCILGFTFIFAARLGVIFLVPRAVLLFIDLFIIPGGITKSLKKKASADRKYDEKQADYDVNSNIIGRATLDDFRPPMVKVEITDLARAGAARRSAWPELRVRI